MLVFYNDAAALLLGKPFAELGEIPAGEFGAVLELATPEGEIVPPPRLPRRHRVLPAPARARDGTGDGVRRRPPHVRGDRLPALRDEGDMHGVISVFWEGDAVESAD